MKNLKIKVRNSLNYVKILPEPLLGLSLTIPDRSMSITEIMTRFARGEPLGGRTDVFFDEDNEHDDMKDYDLTEIAEMKEEHSKNFRDLQENQKKFKKKLDEENEENKFNERVKKEGYAKDIPKETPPNV